MSFSHEFQIGSRTIGAGHPCFVIAEAGVSHDGQFDRACELVRAAVLAQADAIKFQAFRADRLVTARARSAAYQQDHAGAASQLEMLRRLELGEQRMGTLAAMCREQEMEFLATPFSVEDLHGLVSLEVPAIKLASTDLTNTPLLLAAAETGLPLLLSTGTCEAAEIATALERVQSGGAREVVLLHCVSAYPTAMSEANIRRVTSLAAEFGAPVGFSDHTESEQSGALAAACGACVIEKHLTLNRSLPGPDHFFALEPAMFGRYTHAIRRAEAMLGDGSLQPRAIEAEVRDVARRGVVAATFIAAGNTLSADQLTCKRPAGPIEPDRLSDLIGRRACRDIGADEPLDWSMVE
jgi:N-acetylneuraminate synthase/N,N'-diacetyllegionaminate synthase